MGILLRSIPWVLLVIGLPAPLARGTGAAAACVGDCHADGAVTVDELVLAVNIALGQAGPATCPGLDRNEDGAVTIDELVTAVNNALGGCTAAATPTATPTGEPTRSPTVGGQGLGKRRFSINAGTSRFSVKGLPLPLESTSIDGFLEFEAGPVDPLTGNRPVHLTDASEFISIWLVPPIGMPTAVCVRPVVEQFPVEHVGELACEGDRREGVILTQDHNITDVDPECRTGTSDVNPNHAGVCNGSVIAEIIEGDSGPGGMAIAPDIETQEGGLRMETFVEKQLPCGDEPGTSRGVEPWVLSTGRSRARILDADNVPGATLEFEHTGENFSCANWTTETAPAPWFSWHRTSTRSYPVWGMSTSSTFSPSTTRRT